MSEKKLMTVADLADYLRTIPNQNMPVRIEATGYAWHDHDHENLIELSGDISYIDHEHDCRIHVHDDNAFVSELDEEYDEEFDYDFDGNFLDSEPDLVARSKQMADFYGVRG